MSYFDWQSRYQLGVDAMDGEHKVLIELMNKLWDRNQAGASHNEQKLLLLELERTTVAHFEHEERYMESISYPKLKVHKSIHAQLLADLAKHRAAFLMSGGNVSDALFSFLKLWLSSHICGVDKMYSDFQHRAAAAG